MIDFDIPATPAHQCLDGYLAQGLFRNGYMMASAPLVLMDGDVYPVVSVRTRVDRFGFSKSQRRVMRRNDARFRVEVGPGVAGAQRERLYEFGEERFVGYMMESLSEMLAAEPFASLFETEEVAVYDGDRLVAVSYFDSGRHSVASLLGLYDPEYRAYGLGIYTLLVELQRAIERGHRYYYPGFVVLGNDRLDYKLRLGPMQYLDAAGRWRALSGMPRANRLRERIIRRTAEVSRRLDEEGVAHRRRANPYFWFAYAGILHADAVEAAIFLQAAPLDGDMARLIVEYEPEADHYVVARVAKSPEMAGLIGGRVSREASDPVYCQEPLEREERLWVGSDAREAARRLARALG